MGSFPAPLLTIPDDAIDFGFTPPQYENDFAQIVGNAATDSDGFDALFSDASSILTTFPDFATGLDLAIAAMDAAIPEIDVPWEQDFSDTITGAITQGDPDFQQFAVDMTGNSPPPASGSPPSTGTQTTATYSATITISAFVDNFTSQKQISATCTVQPKAGGAGPQQPAPNSESWDFGTAVYGASAITLTGEIVNQSNYPFAITGITLASATSGRWSFAASSSEGTFAPGASFSISITFYPPSS